MPKKFRLPSGNYNIIIESSYYPIKESDFDTFVKKIPSFEQVFELMRKEIEDYYPPEYILPDYYKKNYDETRKRLIEFAKNSVLYRGIDFHEDYPISEFMGDILNKGMYKSNWDIEWNQANVQELSSKGKYYWIGIGNHWSLDYGVAIHYSGENGVIFTIKVNPNILSSNNLLWLFRQDYFFTQQKQDQEYEITLEDGTIAMLLEIEYTIKGEKKSLKFKEGAHSIII